MKSRKPAVDRHVRLHHYLMRTEAWRSLDTVARCAYIELASRYVGHNNGLIPYSVRQMAEALRVGKATALRAFNDLKDRGFIVEMKKGAFSLKVRHATEWRLTEFGTAHAPMPSKDFARWTRKNTVPPENPNGFQNRTARVL